MIISTRFSNGDEVYGIQKTYSTDSWCAIGPLTIGRVEVKITDSPGIGGEDTFSNYMEQRGFEENYMCVETGIGTGTVYRVDTLFRTHDDAKAYAKKRNTEIEK